jgi:hypothetical protein
MGEICVECGLLAITKASVYLMNLSIKLKDYGWKSGLQVKVGSSY